VADGPSGNIARRRLTEEGAELTVRGIGLISGGLDSMLAARLLMDQGIEVTGITFVTPFFSSAKAEAASRQVGFPLIVRDITAPHLAMVKAPPSGYGANMNPCIDCHAMMVSEA
jgi:tRNA U34 2-thiouridine synthase MnmA/TrmU